MAEGVLFLSLNRDELIQQIWEDGVAIELRLDLFERIDCEAVRQALRRSDRPVMLTVRKRSHGGGFQGDETERELLIRRLLALEPPFFDLEYDMRPEFIRDVLKAYPRTRFLLSYHHFEKTPADLERIYCSMRKYRVFGYKIAAMARCASDALRMLLFAKNHPKVSAICMGDLGGFARVLGPVAGNLVNYACGDATAKTAPGQLTVSELTDVYDYRSLNRETAIFGLIGDPVEKSPGHLYHNAVFQKRGVNAVYVKMNVKSEELAEFIPLAKAVGVRGLSVTIPLKEKILPFLDEVEPAAMEIGAVNTLLFREGKIIGTNTDGLGALDAIEKRTLVRGKRVVLLGAGGAARGIAFEAMARGGDVLVLNRTVQRAKEVAAELGCEGGGLDEVPCHYEIIVNCSPDPMPIEPSKIRAGALAMDVVYSPRETPFLREAALRGCQIVYGEEMFQNQAVRQTAFWLGV